MNTVTTSVDIKRSFGLKVLLKLTSGSIKGIKISSIGNKIKSNVSMSELTDAINRTIERHNIDVKSG